MSQQLFRHLSHAVNEHEDVALLTITKHTSEQLIGKKCLLMKNGEIKAGDELPSELKMELIETCSPLLHENKTATIELKDEAECYTEVFLAPPHLIVAGAGHVSEPVAEMGKMLGFYVTVIDDREAFANKKQFPYADEVVCTSYIEFFRNVPITPNTYILLLTRGHKFDVVSLQELLKREEAMKREDRTAYIGMIGSRRRIAGVFSQLQSEFTEHNFINIHSPVGLDVGAQTPAEIAVSILAEILMIKNKTSGHSLKNKIRSYSQLKFRERKERVK